MQEMREQEEQKQREKLEDEEHIKALEKELEELEHRKKSFRTSYSAPFLWWLYGAHPPPRAPPIVKFASGRKDLLAAVQLYHTDKNGSTAGGRRWYLLCREITKTLNSVIEQFDAAQPRR